jgi:lipopolysaccharide transport system ATP-binding protein
VTQCSSPPAISVSGLGKAYFTGGTKEPYGSLRHSLARRLHRPFSKSTKREFWALKDVSFEVERGQVLGVVGRNGAGKSTLLKLLSRITEPSEGTAVMRGRVGSLLEVGTGFHPELTGRENIFLNGAILGMTRREIARSFDQIVDFSEVGDFIDTPVKYFSSGMYVRLAFSVAAHMEPDILIVDEVLAVGDIGFQRRCLGKIEEARRKERTVLLVSHDLGAILRLAGAAILLDGGRVAGTGSAAEMIQEYLRRSFPSTSRIEYQPDASKSAQILRFEISDGSQKAGSAIAATAPLVVDIEIDVRSRSTLDVACMIESAERTLLVDVSTSMSEQMPHEWTVGLHRVRMRFPAGLLNAGRYLIRVGLGRTDGTLIDAHATDGLSMELVGSSGEVVGRRGVLGLLPEFSTTSLG